MSQDILGASDPHVILGVSRGVDAEGLRKAFRAKARAVHPDQNPNDPNAAAKFARVKAAYDELKEQPQAGVQTKEGNWDLSDPLAGFGDFFDQAAKVGRGARQAHAAQRKPAAERPQLHVLTISLENAFRGGRFAVREGRGQCSVCAGEGRIASANEVVCFECDGHGSYFNVSGRVSVEAFCRTCDGKGRCRVKRCLACAGSGEIHGEELQIDIPAGCAEGFEVRVRRGQVEDVVLVKIADHRRFRRQDEHLEVFVNIPTSFAALGGRANVLGIDGAKVEFLVPAGTVGGQIITVPQQGMPAFSGRGDLNLRVVVSTPDVSSPEVRKLMIKLRELGQ